jgi:hypothetical protein
MTRHRSLLGVGLAVVLSLSVCAGTIGSAGADVGANKKKFCKAVQKKRELDVTVLSSDPETAEAAIKDLNRLLKAKPPKKVAKALKTMRKAHKALAEGEDPAQVAVDAFDAATDVVGSYAAANCLF